MVAVDYAGTWEYKGTIAPLISVGNSYRWSRFPFSTTAANGTIRLTYYGEIAKILTYGFIRNIFDVGELVAGPWKRIYPSEEKQILVLPIPEEILINSSAIPRYFEVTKRYKWPYRSRLGKLQDDAWSVALEVLEEPALPAEVYDQLNSAPQKVISIGQSGNIVIVLEGDNQ